MRRSIGRARRRVDGEGGAAAIEFALVASLLIVLVFGIIEFGRAYSEYQVLQGAAREGARAAAVRAPASEVVARVRESAGSYELSGSPSVSTQCTDENTGSPVSVRWTQVFQISLPFLPDFHQSAEIKGVFRCE